MDDTQEPLYKYNTEEHHPNIYKASIKYHTMQHDLTPDKTHIAALVKAAERRVGYTLSRPDFDFCVGAITNFIADAIEKFVEGAREHADGISDGNFVESVSHKQEMKKEIIDLFFYLKGLEDSKHES
jgi:hypothetical protein